jgi:hypothetical protein
MRLVEAALKGGWGPVGELLAMLPGAHFDALQVRAMESKGRAVLFSGGALAASVLVVFVLVVFGTLCCVGW